ncbi:class I SAM-dependent methyltransferase [Saccharophagus degradans]|nr:methyltransferase domain-containing protein [Saccharophagus degradans]
MKKLQKKISNLLLALRKISDLKRELVDSSGQGHSPLELFLAESKKFERPRVLELGTLRSDSDRSTKHDAWIPQAAEYLGLDICKGIDVDVVADIHKATDTLGEEKFDIIISCSSFEHFKYPHLAAHQIMKLLKVGGILYIQTHQSFPIHAYPYDYFRFSREALEGLFGKAMNFNVVSSGYDFPAKIVSRRRPFSFVSPAFLNVTLYGLKKGPTPSEYIYELDTEL